MPQNHCGIRRRTSSTLNSFSLHVFHLHSTVCLMQCQSENWRSFAVEDKQHRAAATGRSASTPMRRKHFPALATEQRPQATVSAAFCTERSSVASQLPAGMTAFPEASADGADYIPTCRRSANRHGRTKACAPPQRQQSGGLNIKLPQRLGARLSRAPGTD